MQPILLKAQDTLTLRLPDSLFVQFPDTAALVVKDTVTPPAADKNVLKSKVDYSAMDSIRFEIKTQKVFL